MGKNGSKHESCDPSTNEECYLVNAHLNKALEEQIWKKTTKTGYNLANYNMNQSLSELSIHLEDKPDNTDMKDGNKDSNMPLKVELPPMKTDNDTGKVFLFDQMEDKEKGEKEQESKLNIEEFECGVHFGGGENSKQEWSFTLYDFDGHGKITKEDLVGLLKALYDAVGSSIKIPNNGTKTLKLRLSVGQDAAAQGVDMVTQGPANNDTEEKTVKESPKKKDISKNKENLRLKGSPRSKVKEFSRLNNIVTSPKCNNETAAAQSKVTPPSAKSRLSSQKHKELAELVQENMERNHIRQLRRHHSDCRGCHQEHQHHKRRHRGPWTTNAAKDASASHAPPTCNNKPSAETPPQTQNIADTDDTPKESQDRRNYYLDLAGVENNTSRFQTPTTTQSTALETGHVKNSGSNNTKECLNNSISNTSKFQPIKSTSALPVGKFCAPKHFRSRSHELGEKKCNNINTTRENERCHKQSENGLSRSVDHTRSRSFDRKENVASPMSRVQKGNPASTPVAAGQQGKPARFRPVSLPAQIPEATSPHYHRRHRNREKDHNMAMQQVAEWIEREHTLDIDGDRIVIQRHEHHHVHEHHHHHHYHHYYEA